MRNQEKRIDKLSAQLPAKERALAIVDAIGRNDMSTAKSLQSSTPRISYTQADAAVVDTVQAVEIFSLRFDRVFYSLVSTLLSLYQSERKDLGETISRTEGELCALIAGMELFAKRTELSVDQILAFSMVLDLGLMGLYRSELDMLSEEELANAKAISSAMEELWGGYSGFSPFAVAAA